MTITVFLGNTVILVHSILFTMHYCADSHRKNSFKCILLALKGKHNMDLTDFTMGTVGQCYVQLPQGLNH